MKEPIKKIKDSVLEITDKITPQPLEEVVNIVDDAILEPVSNLLDDFLSIF